MISADTSVFVNYFRGTNSLSTKKIQNLLSERQLIMNPFVLSELLSSPKLTKKIENHLLDLPRIEIDGGFFERAGYLRRKIYEDGNGLPMADIYIAQACIDSEVSLLTTDQDFKIIAKCSALQVIHDD